MLQVNHTTGRMEQLCEHRTQGIKTRKASGLSDGTGGKSGVLIKKTGVHRKKQKLLNDTRKTRSSLGKASGIEGNTRKRWRSTRLSGRTENDVEVVSRNTKEMRRFLKGWCTPEKSGKP